MPAKATGFSILINARDLTAQAFAKVNTALGGLPKAAARSAKQFEHDFGKVNRTALDLARSLGDAVKPFKQLEFIGAGVGVSALAGSMYDLAQSQGALVRQARNTAVNLGMPTATLINLGRAAELAGVSAAAMTGGLEALQGHLYGAAWGTDAGALAVMRMFGISARDGHGHVRSLTAVLPQLANKIAQIHDPMRRLWVATQLFDGYAKDLMAMLMQGSDGIQRWLDVVRSHTAATRQSTQASLAFDAANRDLRDSIGGLKTAIAEQLDPSLTADLKMLKGWTDAAQHSKTVLDAVQLSGEALAGVVGLTMVTGLAKLTKALIKFNAAWLASPLGRALSILAAFKALGILTASPIPQKLTPSEYKKYAQEHFDPAKNPAPPPDWLTRQSIKLFDWLLGRKTTMMAPAGHPGGYARGGIVPGAFGSDTVPAMLTPGEIVLPRDLAQGFQALIRGARGGGLAHDPADYREAGQAFARASGATLRHELPDVLTRAWREALDRLTLSGAALLRGIIPQAEAAEAPGGGSGPRPRPHPSAGAGHGADKPPGAKLPEPHLPPAPVLPPAPKPTAAMPPAPVLPPAPKPTAAMPPAPVLPPAPEAIRPPLMVPGPRGRDFAARAAWAIGRLQHDFGLTRDQAAGLMGNLGYESAGFKHLQELHPLAGRGGYGWAQWTGVRRRQFEAWAAAHHLNLASNEANLGFLEHELRTNYRSTIAALKRQSTLAAATFSVGQTYERPYGTTVTHLPGYAGRLAYARRALAGLPASAPAAPSLYGTAGAVAAATDTKHHVHVEFANAPRGLRAGIRAAEGPATAGLRVRYALDTPS